VGDLEKAVCSGDQEEFESLLAGIGITSGHLKLGEVFGSFRLDVHDGIFVGDIAGMIGIAFGDKSYHSLRRMDDDAYLCRCDAVPASACDHSDVRDSDDFCSDLLSVSMGQRHTVGAFVRRRARMHMEPFKDANGKVVYPSCTVCRGDFCADPDGYRCPFHPFDNGTWGTRFSTSNASSSTNAEGAAFSTIPSSSNEALTNDPTRASGHFPKSVDPPTSNYDDYDDIDQYPEEMFRDFNPFAHDDEGHLSSNLET